MDTEQTDRREMPAIEWSSTIRNWWRYEPADQAMIHRSSGETVTFRGPISVEAAAELKPNSKQTSSARTSHPPAQWFRFDYEFGSEIYPMLVEQRRVRYANAWPERYARAPYNSVVEPESDLSVWRLDHIRSAQLWEQLRGSAGNSPLEPDVPYTLWRRADRAMVDAALLWPREFSVLPPADELAVNGGWLNGLWTPDFFRRLYPRDPELFKRLVSGTRAHCKILLPLEEYTTELPFSSSPVWENVADRSVGFYGERIEGTSPMLRNKIDGTLIARAADVPDYRSQEKTGAFVTVRDNLFVTLLMTSSEEVNLLEGWPGRNSGSVNASWNLMVFGRCAMGLVDPTRPSPAFISKRVRARDSITGRESFWFYYSDVHVDHPLLSFQLWQWLNDCFVNALPFSRGFESAQTPPAVTQGEIGRIYLDGGFIGGIHLLATEVRRKLRLPDGQGEGSSWSAFFE